MAKALEFKVALLRSVAETGLRICRLPRTVPPRSGRTLKLENSVGNRARMWIRRIYFGFYSCPPDADNDARAFNRDNRRNLQIHGRCVVPTAGMHSRGHSRLPFPFPRHRYPYFLETSSLFPTRPFSLSYYNLNVWNQCFNRISTVFNADKCFKRAFKTKFLQWKYKIFDSCVR